MFCFFCFFLCLSSLAEAAAPVHTIAPSASCLLCFTVFAGVGTPLASLFIYYISGDVRLLGRAQTRCSLPPPAVRLRLLAAEKRLLTRFSPPSQSSWPFRTQNTNIRLLFSLQNERPFKRHSRKRVKETRKVRQSRLHFRFLIPPLSSVCLSFSEQLS